MLRLLLLTALAGPALAQQPQANQIAPAAPAPSANSSMGSAVAPPGSAAPGMAPMPLSNAAPVVPAPPAPPAATSAPASPATNNVPSGPAMAPSAASGPPPMAAGGHFVARPAQPSSMPATPAATAAVPPPPPPPAPRAPVPPAPPSPPVSGLPADAPKLVINGGTYSQRPELRMVIVNGRVAREGADLGSGVVLQQIRPSSVVLAFKGAQYNVWY